MSKADKARFAPRLQSEAPEQLFASAEAAWFWYMRAQRARLEGARLSGAAATFQRPCCSDDIYRWVMGLYRHRRLTTNELRVLAVYGWRETPPDGRLSGEADDAKTWDRALDTLGSALVARGVMESGAEYQ